MVCPQLQYQESLVILEQAEQECTKLGKDFKAVHVNGTHCGQKHQLYRGTRHNVREILQTLSKQPRSGELRTQKLESHLVRTQNLKVLPLKPGVGQYIHIYIHGTLTAGNFFLAYFYPSGPFTCIFSKPFPDFSCCGCG